MIFLALIIMAGAVLLVLMMSRKLNRTALECAVIAVLIGVAGYIWQGSPMLSSSPAGHAPMAEQK